MIYMHNAEGEEGDSALATYEVWSSSALSVVLLAEAHDSTAAGFSTPTAARDRER